MMSNSTEPSKKYCIDEIRKQLTVSEKLGIEDVSAFGDGHDASVFAITTEDNQSMILRLNLANSISFYEEVLNQKLVASAGIPTAKIWGYGEIPLSGGDYEYMLLEKLDGALVDYNFDNESELELMQTRIGGLIAKIQHIPLSFGDESRLARNGIDSNKEFMRQRIDRVKAKRDILTKLYTSEQLDKLITKLTELVSKVARRELVLSHGDLLPRHIFVYGDGEISGLIDFGELGLRLPSHDIVYITYEYPQYDINNILKGYSADISTELMFDEICIGLECLDWDLRHGVSSRIDRLKDRLSQTL